MQKTSEVLKTYQIPRRKLYSKEQDLADQIYHYFHKQVPFSRLMRIIKETGYKAIWEIWSEVKQSKADNQLSLFLWICKKEREKIFSQII